MKSLVTGNAGFIGSHLADRLIEEGDKVFGVDNLSTGKRENINPKTEFIEHDLTDKSTVELVKKIKPDRVFHLAALARIQPSIKDPIKWNDNNTNATLNLLWGCKEAGTVKKLVYSGSSSVYGKQEPPFWEDMQPQPMSPYSLAKYFGEEYCHLFSHLYDVDTSVLRYFNVYGPRQVLEGDYATVIGIFLNQKDQGKKLTIVGDGTQKRDFTWVYDVCDANIKASEKEGFGIYNIGTNENYEIRDIAKMIQPDESMHEYGLVRVNEAKETLAGIERVKHIGWTPKVSVPEGIAILKGENDV